jgi:glycosyltransferase involved in cell wall biosynthesis
VKKNKYSILHLQSSSDLYGSDICLYHIIKESSKIYKSIIVLPYEGPLIKYLKQYENIKIYIYDFGVLRKKYFNFFGLLNYLYHLICGIIFLFYLVKKEGINTIHTNTSVIIAGGILSRILGIKHIWHVRQIIDSPRIFSKCLNTIIVLFSTEIIAISHAVKENILANSYIKKGGKIRVIFDGIDYQELRRNLKVKKYLLKKYKIKNDELVVGMVGRINPFKGQDTFINAAKIIIDKNIKAKFFIVGDTFKGYEGSLLYLKEMVKQLRLEKNVFFAGFIEDKLDIYNLFDVFVHVPISPEGLGLVILEAMANGLPVIAANCGGPKEIIIDGVSGLLVPPGDPEILAAKIIYLSENQEMRKKLGDTALNEVPQRFSLDKTGKQIMQIYEKLNSMRNI